MTGRRRRRLCFMTIELPAAIEKQLRSLATQGRDVDAVGEDAVRQYLRALAITDLEPDDVAETQAKLVAELPAVSDWKAGKR